jgi:hypothetical protein
VSGSNSLQGGSAGAYVGATFLDLGGVGDRFLLNAPADLNGAGQLSLVGVNSSGFNGIWNFSTSPAAELLITPAQIAATASNGTNVILQANNDIILAEASTISIVPIDGKPGDLTLQAGRSIRLDSPIETGGGNLLLVANDPDALAAYREGGLGGVTMAYGTSIDSADGAVTIRSLGGSAGLIDLQSISASALTVEGDGGIQWVGPSAQITVSNGPIQFLADTVDLQSGVIASNHAVEFKTGTSLSLSDIQFTGSGLVSLRPPPSLTVLLLNLWPSRGARSMVQALSPSQAPPTSKVRSPWPGEPLISPAPSRDPRVRCRCRAAAFRSTVHPRLAPLSCRPVRPALVPRPPLPHTPRAAAPSAALAP